MTTHPVSGRSRRCPFQGQVENWVLLKCREKRHQANHPLNQRDLKFNPPIAERCSPGIHQPPTTHLSVQPDTLRPGTDHKQSRLTVPLLDAVVLELLYPPRERDLKFNRPVTAHYHCQLLTTCSIWKVRASVSKLKGFSQRNNCFI